MKHKNSLRWGKLTLIGIVLLTIGCGLFQNPNSNPIPTSTPTPTSEGGSVPATSPPVPINRCDGMSGSLEMQVLAGPAAVVGMEPFAVGTIPFSVVTNGQSNTVQGNGAISYQQVLEKEWGTYTVSLDLNVTVSGECRGNAGSEVLNMTVEVSGDQMVEVRAEGFEGDYPWSGTHELELTFPLEEGASAEGEGWAFILHLNE